MPATLKMAQRAAIAAQRQRRSRSASKKLHFSGLQAPTKGDRYSLVRAIALFGFGFLLAYLCPKLSAMRYMSELLVSSSTIKDFLASNTLFCQKMLLECHLMELKSNLLISTKQNHHLAHALTLRRESLIRAARLSCISHITVTTGSEVWCSLPVATESNSNQSSTTIMYQNLIQSNIPVVQPLDLRKELYNFNGSAKALLFFDDLGVDSNDNVEASSGVRPNKWLHLQHKDFWLEDELTAYKRRLLTEKELSNYEYIAFLTNGQKCRFNVDARLATYRGDLIRIVKVNSCIPA